MQIGKPSQHNMAFHTFFIFDVSPKSVLWKQVGLLIEVNTVCFHQCEGTGHHIMQFCNTVSSISEVKFSLVSIFSV